MLAIFWGAGMSSLDWKRRIFRFRWLAPWFIGSTDSLTPLSPKYFWTASITSVYSEARAVLVLRGLAWIYSSECPLTGTRNGNSDGVMSTSRRRWYTGEAIGAVSSPPPPRGRKNWNWKCFRNYSFAMPWCKPVKSLYASWTNMKVPWKS